MWLGSVPLHGSLQCWPWSLPWRVSWRPETKCGIKTAQTYQKQNCKFFKPVSHIHTCLCTVLFTSFIIINTKSLKTQDFYYLWRVNVLVLLKYDRQHAIIIQSKLELLITQCYSLYNLHIIPLNIKLLRDYNMFRIS